MKIRNYIFSLLLIPFFGIAQNAKINPLDQRSIKGHIKNEFTASITTITGSSIQDNLSPTNSLSAINPIRTEVNLRQTDLKRRSILNTAHAMEQAFLYLKTNSTLIHSSFDADKLTFLSSETDAIGYSHVRMQQIFKGVEVEGCEIFVHFSGSETFTHGQWAGIPKDFSTIALVKQDVAVDNAISVIQPEFGFTTLSKQQKALLNYTAPEVKTMVSFENNKATLCYEIMVRPNAIERWIVKVNASNGTIMEVYNNTCHADGPRVGTGSDLNGVSRTVNSYQIGSTFHLLDATKSMYNSSESSLPDNPVGAIWTLDAGNTAGTNFNYITSGSANFNNTKAVSAHYNAGVAFDYFKNTFNRNSINGMGGTIISVINVTDESGNNIDNAYWNGQFIAYGNGRTQFKPLAGALDVAGHEMTHGVVQNTANLEYKGQSGAINESMADIFGCMMDRSDWKMGEDIVKPGFFAGGALRNLQDPHNGGNSLADNGYQPKKMSEYYTGTGDNGGVHINSGIPNHAYYLFATSVTREKAELVYYRALNTYLTKSSQFKDLRLAVLQAATDLYGGAVVTAAGAAFDAVEIFGPIVNNGNIGNNVADLKVNPGQDFILYSDEDPSTSFTITKGTISSGATVGQVTRVTKRKPSVLDDGSYCIYVGNDGRIYSLKLDGSKTETVLQNQPVWENVAISKDGKRMAAITTNIDTSIYVYNFATSTWKKFRLYNPTFSGVNSGGVQFADALDWDHTGTKVMYDAKNLIDNQSGTDYTYWDVGILNVWNLETNDWSDGKIEKLFSSLPDGISIGNAVFSQRSPYIVAFDYVDADNFQSIVTGYNLNTNKTAAVFSGSDLGFPCFSKNDDIMIFNASSTGGNPVVAQKALAADKITGTGTASILVDNAKWGVWYANGTRPLLFSDKDILSFTFEGLNPKVSATIIGTNITVILPGSVDITALTPSFTHSAYSYVKVGNTKQTSGVNSNNFTNTVVYTVVAQDGSTKNYNVNVSKSATGLQSYGANQQIVIYPNPASDELNIINNKPIISLFVYSIQGVLVNEMHTDHSKSVLLNTRTLQTGMYILIIKTTSGEQVVRFSKL